MNQSIIDEIKALIKERNDLVLAAIAKMQATIKDRPAADREDANFRRSVDNLTNTMINSIHQDIAYLNNRTDRLRTELRELQEKVRKLSGEP